MKLLLDGVCFQIYQPALSNLWVSVITSLTGRAGIEVLVLDRGCMSALDGVFRIEFPPYKFLYAPDDSFLIQKICEVYEVDVFISCYFTSAIATPTVLMLNDMIPERHEFVAADRRWSERETAISFARHLVVASNSSAAAELRHAFPEVPAGQMSEVDLFCDFNAEPQPLESQSQQVRRSSIVFYAVDDDGYRAYEDFAASLAALSEPIGLDAIVIGDPVQLQTLGYAATDTANDARPAFEDLGRALDHGAALVCPKPMDGYELLCVASFMRGCPVIGHTDAAVDHLVGHGFTPLEGVPSVHEVTKAIAISKDAANIPRIGWNVAAIADRVVAAAEDLSHRHKAGAYDRFFRQWAKLRKLQSSVDEGTMY